MLQFHWRVENGGAVLIGCDDPAGHVAVPEEAMGLPVIAVGDRAFLGADRMTGIDLPPTLTRIGQNAFLGCAALRSVALPDGVTALGTGAFEGCASLQGALLSPALTEIPPRAFYLCRSLQAIRVPDHVAAIGQSAFSGCAALTGVSLPEGLHTVGPEAFAGCAALRGVRIPRSVTRIDATSLPVQLHTRGGLYLPGSGLLIRATASLRWAAPEGTRILADGALAGNHDLTEAALPDTVTAIGDRAFADCRCLHHIGLPEGLERLGREAFRDCRRLTGVVLPRRLNVLSDGLFEGSGLMSATLPEGVARLGDRAFAGCADLRQVMLNPGLERIGASAFARCTSLKAIALPQGLLSIGPHAFLDCRALETVTLPAEALPEGLADALTDLRRVRVVAPALPPEAFPPLWRKRVCLGFAHAAQAGVPYRPEVREACLSWLAAHAAALTGEAANDPALLRLLLDHRLLSPADARRLVDRFSRQDDTETVLELLHYARAAQEDEGEALW